VQTQTNTTHSVSWQGQTMMHHKRGALWYTVAAAIVLSVLVFCVVTTQWPLLVVMLIGTVFYGWLLFKPTPETTITLTQNEVVLNSTHVAYSECAYFWILDHGHDHELHIKLKERNKADIRIFLGDTDTVEVQQLLSEYMEQNTKQNEQFIDIITRLLKL
jgi:hypothetical protein